MARDDQGGRSAARPRELSRGWIDVFRRARHEAKADSVGLISAGVAFYAFFAIFPGLAALVAVYGLVADPAQVESQVASLSTMMPAAALDIVRARLRRVAQTPESALGLGFIVTLLVTLWSASKGAQGLVKALNIAYDEEERRGFVKRTALVLLLTIGGVIGAIVALAIVVGVPAVIGNVGLGTTGVVLAHIARWVILAAVVVFSLAVVYRFAPSRDAPKWRWVTPGSLLATFLLLLASVVFSLYVQYFNSYQSTFGSLGAVAILLMWFFIGALAVVLGGELNAESERQTRRDTTRGPERPLGERGAYAADTLGEAPA